MHALLGLDDRLHGRRGAGVARGPPPPAMLPVPVPPTAPPRVRGRVRVSGRRQGGDVRTVDVSTPGPFANGGVGVGRLVELDDGVNVPNPLNFPVRGSTVAGLSVRLVIVTGGVLLSMPAPAARRSCR